LRQRQTTEFGKLKDSVRPLRRKVYEHKGKSIVNALDDLKQCPDVATLKPALQKLCEKFGKIARLDVLTAMHEGTKQAICFLRLDAPDKEVALMKALGVGRFAGEIVFVVDLNNATTSPGAKSASSASSSGLSEARGME
jgi:hypothetical protein